VARNTDQSLVEDYRQGYPRFSALIAAEKSFHLCRRFSNLRARLLLIKQDELSKLEKDLEEIDQEESRVLFLGSIRSDCNEDRKKVLSKIGPALKEYGSFHSLLYQRALLITSNTDALVERNNKVLSYGAAKSRHVLSLQNWVDNNACIARAETAYLTHCNELLSVAPLHDGATEQLEAWIADRLVQFCKNFRKVVITFSAHSKAWTKRCKGPRRDVSRDSLVYIFSGSLTARLSRIVFVLLILVFLLAPIILCNVLHDIRPRTVVVVVATILFLVMLSALTKAKIIEMLVATTTWVD
jgi:hypothetical protein